MRVRRTALAAAAALALAGCGSNNFRDVEGVTSRVPPKIEVWSNVDNNPNIVMVCIHGVAFATTTRDYASVMRVPEWDGPQCGATR